MSNTPPPSAAPEPAANAAAAEARARARARATVLEFAATRGLTYLPAHIWGYVRTVAATGAPAELVVAVVEAAGAAQDDVRARFAVDGHVGLRNLLDVERARSGGAS